MPWKVSSAVEERLLFVARLIEGEAMTDLCREFQVSRKTGYKIFNRYKNEGLNALTDRCRRPVRYANQLPAQVEALIVRLKRDKPHWGARKIRELLIRRLPGDLRPPAKSTVHAVLDRHGLVARMGRRRTRAQGTPLSQAAKPNDLWCADYKGEFKLGDGRYCYPLTVTDQASRFLLMCEAQDSVRENQTVSAFERLFHERGLPHAIRSDNGVPFASPNGLFNLSKLAVWWLRLGIDIERIKPGNPQQNGRHERMHRTLKAEATRPAGMNFLQQQARFDAFVDEFNTERPHEALAMKRPDQMRERALTEEEASRLWTMIAEAQAASVITKDFADIFRLIMLTGARRNEIVALRWSEVDLDRARIVLPPVRTKMGALNRSRLIALSQPALEILQAVKRRGEHVFPSSVGDQPLVGVNRAWDKVRVLASIPDVRLHDLRHSFATFAVEGGASLHHVGRALGHPNATIAHERCASRAKRRVPREGSHRARAKRGRAPGLSTDL